MEADNLNLNKNQTLFYNSFHCRLCSEKNLNGCRLFENSNENVELNIDVINEYLPVKIFDDKKYPNWICSSCRVKVKATVQFFNLIEIGQEKLNEKRNHFMQKSIKNQNQQQISLLRSHRTQRTQIEQNEEDDADILTIYLVEKPNNAFLTRGIESVDSMALRIKQETVVSNDYMCENRGIDKRPIKVRKHYKGVIHGEEYEKVFRDVNDDAIETKNVKSSVDKKNNGNKSIKKSINTNTDDGNIDDGDSDVIGYIQRKTGDNLGYVIIANVLKNPNSRIKQKLFRFFCDICQLKFLYEGKFFEHPCLSIINVRHECKDCLKTFQKKELLIEHQLNENHNGSGIIGDTISNLSCEDYCKRYKIVYLCNKCDKQFSSKEELRDHQLKHITTKPYKCHVCGKEFKLKSILTAHITLHTGNKKFSCIICKQKFAHKRSLRLHKYIHEKLKPYKCEQCDKYFTQKGNMQEHLRIHRNEKPYKCLMCDKNFRTNSQHKKHIKRCHHQQQLNGNHDVTVKSSKSSSNNNHCTKCNKRFYDLQSLKKHLRIHTGEKPYKCFRCMKQFSDRSNFKKHQKIHLKAKNITENDNYNNNNDNEDELKLQQKNNNNESNDLNILCATNSNSSSSSNHRLIINSIALDEL